MEYGSKWVVYSIDGILSFIQGKKKMRKIKCRGRDEEGKWHYGYYVDGYMFDDMLGLWESVPFIVQRQLEVMFELKLKQLVNIQA